MGGAMEVVNTTLNTLTDAVGLSQSINPPDTAKQLRAERQAQEKELQKKEDAERKRLRDNVTEARERERRRQTAKEGDASGGRTTLLNGGAGLEDDPAVAAPKLKEKFGE